jgi:hypothetical protein
VKSLITLENVKESQMEEKEQYQLLTSVNEGIFEIVVTGELTESTHTSATKEIASITKKKAEKMF